MSVNFENMTELETQLVVARLNRDLRRAADELSETEARYLVQAYYNIQEFRIRCHAQVSKLDDNAAPHVVLSWLAQQSEVLEGQIQGALDHFSSHHRFGKWPRSIIGIGPVLAAGLIAHTDINQMPTAGHLWSFAGLDPTKTWERGQKRPWNADLKVLCWKIGQSFMKQRNNERDIYGKVYFAQKEKYIARNESGGMAPNAEKALARSKFRKETDAYAAYSQGKLPPAHIDAMSRRYAVKLFLAHYWEVCWRIDNPGKTPVLPYPVVHMGHAHVIAPPNFDPEAV